VSASAYNLYVNLMASTAGLTGGLRSSAMQLRQFDGQLQQVNRTLIETQSATERLARVQASASVDAVLAQTRVAAASLPITPTIHTILHPRPAKRRRPTRRTFA
jgi:hypothetical protein